jgi:integrase
VTASEEPVAAVTQGAQQAPDAMRAFVGTPSGAVARQASDDRSVRRVSGDADVAQRMAAGELWQDRDLVFCQVNARPIDTRVAWKDWKELLQEAGVRDARVHDGRHTAATLLLEQGVDVRVVQQILGHSQLSQTQRYTHVTSALSKDAMDRMGGVLWGS